MNECKKQTEIKIRSNNEKNDTKLKKQTFHDFESSVSLVTKI